MSASPKDITQTVISTVDIDTKISSIFSDFAILDTQFNIVSVSQNILADTGYTSGEVQGQSVSILSATPNFKKQLEDSLRPGYFEEHLFTLQSKNEEILSYIISGFYMGLIADINGLIILRFRNADEYPLNRRETAASTKELDDFIYATSHSLRGPLATLKGLINLAQIGGNPQEIGFLINQMSVFAERLDEKLHQLIYVAELDKSPTLAPENLSIQSIFQSLSESIKEASIDFPVHFHCPVQDKEQIIERGEIVLSILNSLVLFFCQQPKTDNNILIVDALSSSCAIEIVMRSKGFLLSDSLIDKINNVNFGYSQILNFPELINYYAAKKIMIKLNGNVQFMLIDANEVVVLMTIPRDTSSLSADFHPLNLSTR